MESLDVRIVNLEPLHVASALGFGPEPEILAHQTLLTWARSKNLLQKSPAPRFFGFNNPNPSPGSPNYGYEIWMTVSPDIAAEGDIKIKDFPGGLYGVTRCQNPMNIFQTWQNMVKWAETSSYQLGRHQELEEHIKFIDVPMEEMIFDLYIPLRQ